MQCAHCSLLSVTDTIYEDGRTLKETIAANWHRIIDYFAVCVVCIQHEIIFFFRK